jgi:hypothetical protein
VLSRTLGNDDGVRVRREVLWYAVIGECMFGGSSMLAASFSFLVWFVEFWLWNRTWSCCDKVSG